MTFESTVSGIGFDVDSVDAEKYINFLKKHNESLNTYLQSYNLRQYLDETALEEVDLEDIRMITDGYTLAEPIACIMKEETGIYFYTPGITENCEDYVLYCPSYPWDMTEAERKLTYDELFKLMQYYAAELGVSFKGFTECIYCG